MSENKTKWYEKAPGESSSGRILIMLGGVMGLLMMPAGVAMAFMKIPDSVTVLMTGAGLYAAATGGKAYQNNLEAGK